MDKSAIAVLEPGQESLTNLYKEMQPHFEAQTLKLAAEFEECNLEIEPLAFETILELDAENGQGLTLDYKTAKNYNQVASIAPEELKAFAQGYYSDSYFKNIRAGLREEKNWIATAHPRFTEDDDGLLYFEDWNGNLRLCIPKNQ